MAEERELILKLGKKITDRIPYKLGMEKLTVNDICKIKHTSRFKRIYNNE